MLGWRSLVVLALGAAVVGGCSHNKKATKTVKSRAAFDLSCPEDELTLQVLATEGPRSLATQIGAEGCGQKTVYVYLRSSDTWVANSAVTPAMQQEERAFEERQSKQIRAVEDTQRLQQQQSYQRGVAE